jgi:hypothetical protein
MPQTYRDFLWKLLPAFMRGEFGQRLLMGGVAAQADTIYDSATIAVRSGWALDEACGADALEKIGASRSLPRYPGEDLESYRSRVWGAWQAYAIAGSSLALELQLEAFGLITDSLAGPFDGWTVGSGALAPVVGHEDASGGKAGLLLETTAAMSVYELAVTDLCDVSTGGYCRSCCLEVAVEQGTATHLFLAASGDVDDSDVREQFDLATGQHDPTWADRLGHGVPSARAVQDAPGWRRYRLTFAATGPAVTIQVGIPGTGTIILDGRSVYAGPELVTVHTPIDWTRGPMVHPRTGDDWWSLLWVHVAHELHGAALTTEEKAALVALARKWRDTRWALGGVILEGTAPTCGLGVCCGAGALCGGTDAEVCS